LSRVLLWRRRYLHYKRARSDDVQSREPVHVFNLVIVIHFIDFINVINVNGSGPSPGLAAAAGGGKADAAEGTPEIGERRLHHRQDLSISHDLARLAEAV
jgi:hypothetical protein